MITRTLGVIVLAFAVCAPCFGQTSFIGLTPGQSSRTDAERVLGGPVKKVSETLVEYAPRQLKLTHERVTLNSGKIYVQYRDGSAAAVVERIELLLCASSTEVNRECNVPAMHTEYDRALSSGSSLDAYLKVNTSDGFKFVWYFGSPRYMVRTDIHKTGTEVRWGFYSKELYDGTAPRGNCTGMLRGEWDTNRGRTTFARVDESGKIRGTYSNGKGSLTGEVSGAENISGEWKDDTGSGTMFLQLALPGDKEFKGTWKRTSGKGPLEGTWEGRCVETKAGGNE